MNKTITGKQVGNFLLNNAVIIMMLIAAVVVSILRPNFISEYNAKNLISNTCLLYTSPEAAAAESDAHEGGYRDPTVPAIGQFAAAGGIGADADPDPCFQEYPPSPHAGLLPDL